ncbi:MAG: CRISPR system precrRNA processing endoribonuclease RAMP protein Cas6 [Rhodobacteraceae bacterium]|nr:CRISPR system precrRNA processing endoribonuclease RAMP protein Cas6 [Paracoccaceae bacterium]
MSLIAAVLEQSKSNAFTIQDLYKNWRMAEIRLLIANEAASVENDNLIGKIRGAWGNILLEGSSITARNDVACDWTAPSGLAIFFQINGFLAKGIDFPKPYVFTIEPHGPDMILTLRLFGFAADWAGEAAFALVLAMQRGLDYGKDGNKRRSFEVLDRSIDQSTGLPFPTTTPQLALDFTSPVSAKKGSFHHANPHSILKGIMRRVSGMAPWQGGSLGDIYADLFREIEAMSPPPEWINIKRKDWTRRTVSRGETRQMPISGGLGTLLLPVVSQPLFQVLSLGQYIHAGSQATIGKGRYILRHPA